MIKIITKRNIPTIIKKMERYDSAIILGKGPTFKPIESNNETTLNVAINQAIFYSDHIDALVLNDFDIAQDISNNMVSEKLKDLKYVVVPRLTSRSGHSYKQALELFSANCKKTYAIVHNLNSHESCEDPNFTTLIKGHHCTSSHTASGFISCCASNVRRVDFYGVANSSEGYFYHHLFEKYNPFNSNNQTVTVAHPNNAAGHPTSEDSKNVIKEIKKQIQKTLIAKDINFN